MWTFPLLPYQISSESLNYKDFYKHFKIFFFGAGTNNFEMHLELQRLMTITILWWFKIQQELTSELQIIFTIEILDFLQNLNLKLDEKLIVNFPA